MQDKLARKLESAILATLTRGELEKLRADTKTQIGRIEVQMRAAQSQRDEQTKLLSYINRALSLKGTK